MPVDVDDEVDQNAIDAAAAAMSAMFLGDLFGGLGDGKDEDGDEKYFFLKDRDDAKEVEDWDAELEKIAAMAVQKAGLDTGAAEFVPGNMFGGNFDAGAAEFVPGDAAGGMAGMASMSSMGMAGAVGAAEFVPGADMSRMEVANMSMLAGGMGMAGAGMGMTGMGMDTMIAATGIAGNTGREPTPSPQASGKSKSKPKGTSIKNPPLFVPSASDLRNASVRADNARAAAFAKSNAKVYVNGATLANNISGQNSHDTANASGKNGIVRG